MIRVNIADSNPIRVRINDETTIRVSVFDYSIKALSTSFNEHITDKENPHPTDVVQEFADAQITALKSVTSGGEIPDTDYNAFKSFFTTLIDKSVKSFIRGLIGWVRSLSERVGLLEDKYILKYVVPIDSVLVDLTEDMYGNPFNFVEGDVLEIISTINGSINGIYVMGIQLNGVTDSSQYFYAGTTYYMGLPSYIHSFAKNVSRLYVESDGMIMTTDMGYINAENTAWGRYNVSSFTKPVSRGGIVSAPITRITFFPYSGLIKAGSTIIIKRA